MSQEERAQGKSSYRLHSDAMYELLLELRELRGEECQQLSGRRQLGDGRAVVHGPHLRGQCV